MRYLGVDYGSKKVGLALSDEAGTMGFPKGIIPAGPNLAEELAALARDEGVGAIVLGESRMLSGEPNAIHETVHKLGGKLAELTGLPVAYEPEAFTSAEARRAPHKLEKTRALKSRAPIDDSAAALILTSYLSRTNHG